MMASVARLKVYEINYWIDKGDEVIVGWFHTMARDMEEVELITAQRLGQCDGGILHIEELD